MIDIPLDAKVECTDGPAGRSSYVIIDPEHEQVTHFVVQDKRFHSTERLVPVDLVVDTTPGLIRLNCTRGELAKAEPFIETRIVRRERTRCFTFSPTAQPVYTKEITHVPMKYERIPRGELAVHRGANVQATDGRVGRVNKFLADPSDNHITHLVLCEGHLWHQRNLAIPVSAINRVAKETVYLRLDKDHVASLTSDPERNW